MPNRAPRLPLVAACAAALALAACGGSDRNAIAEIDNEIIGNDIDPALTGALEDQILVDPELAQQSNRNAVRPPERPAQAQYPAGGAAGRMAASAGAGASPGSVCGLELEYGRDWARRLPREFPPYPGGRLTDSAGRDGAGCRARVVTFKTGDAPRAVLDWYHRRATAAGYNAEHQRRGADHVLGGVNPADEGAYYLIVTPEGAGSDVALIVNNGR